MNTAAVVSSISTIIAALVAGWFALLARRAQSQGPESVAGGYSRLVNDMRVEQEAMQLRLAGLEAEREDLQSRLDLQREEFRNQLAVLRAQIRWLMDHIPEEHREEFNELFKDVHDDS